MKIPNRIGAQIHFAAFVVWAFGAYLAFGNHEWWIAAISAIASLLYLALGIYIFRKPDDPDPPTRGTGGFCAA